MLSVSTLGCPGVQLPELLGWLDRARVPGLELRLSSGELADPVMTRRARDELRRRIEDAGHVVTGVASYVRIGSDCSDEMVLGALVSAIDIAADLGAPAVRVFPGAPTLESGYDEVPGLRDERSAVDARMVRRLSAVTTYAEDRGVMPCLETHDSHPTGALVSGVLSQVTGRVGVVWDAMHPWRVGETVADTAAALGPWLGVPGSSVQVKDADLPRSATPLPLGEGAVPLDDFAAVLSANGFRGPVVLEWEKAWHPEAVSLDLALPSLTAWADRHGFAGTP